MTLQEFIKEYGYEGSLVSDIDINEWIANAMTDRDEQIVLLTKAFSKFPEPFIIKRVPPIDSTKQAIEIGIKHSWFFYTTPSFLDIEQYIPDWEDNDWEIGFSYFLNEFSIDVIEKNAHILPNEAKENLYKLIDKIEW